MRENHIFIILIVIALLFLTTLVFQPDSTPTRDGELPERREILVSGEGIITVKPNIAEVLLGVETEAKTAQETQEKNARLMAGLLTKLKNLKIREEDIQTTSLNLFPVRKYNKETGRDELTGYRMTNQVQVIIRDLGALGLIIDQAVRSGANNIHNISFSVDSPEKWQDEALTQAIAKARKKAEVMAEAAGLKIKKVLIITDSTVDLQPYQLDGFRKMKSEAALDTPIEPGAVKVKAHLQMSFEIE